MREQFLRPTIVALTAAGLAILIAACGGGASQTSSTASDRGDAVTIKDFDFGPAALTVTPGTKVTWTNEDSTNHTATAEDGSFDTGTIKPGSKLSATLTKPGTYAYVCQFHPFMHGTITVQG